MSVTVLSAKKRPEKITKSYLKNLRKDGFIPVVYYGQSIDSVSLEVNRKELSDKWDQKTVNTVFNLVVDGSDNEDLAIVRKVERDVIKRNIIHIDFLKVESNKKVRVKIPVRITGEAYGVKTEGGFLFHIRKKVEIEALPEHIPSELVLDVVKLRKGEGIYVRDIVPNNFRCVTPGKQVIAIIEGSRGGDDPASEIAADGEVVAGDEAAAEGDSGEKKD